MRYKNYIMLEFPSLSTNTDIARTAITVFAKQMIPTPTKDDISNITTAVSEAVKNAIIHAYPDQLGNISIKATIIDGDILQIKVSDKGQGIPNVEEVRKPSFTTGGIACSGMGFTIMETFMDTLDVRSTPGKGTTVTMKYHISQK